MTLNLTAAAEKVVLQRAMFPLSGFFMPVSGCLSPWAPWGAATSKLAPSEDWGEEVAELTPVTLLAPDALRCQDLARVGEMNTVPPAAVGARGRQARPSEGRQPFESSDAFSWRGEELVKTQQFLSASLLDKQNVETNHRKLFLLPSVGEKKTLSFVFFLPLSFFFITPLQTKLTKKSLPS